MKIINSKQSREVDLKTMELEPISSIDLMERAGVNCVKEITKVIDKESSVVIFCGIGNNGGDGLVISRLLLQKGYSVQCYLVQISDKYSLDNQINQQRLKEVGGELKIIENKTELDKVEANVFVDALFGSGLSRSVKGLVGEVIDWMNQQKGFKIAIDMPSGLFDEDNRNNTGTIFKADLTLAIQQPKLSLLLEENYIYVGEFKCVDIELNKEAIGEFESNYFFQTKEDFCRKRRKKFSHKGTYGHVHLYAGSLGKMGAAILSSKAIFRSGAGLVTCHIPSVGLQPVQAAFPEAMVKLNHGKDFIEYFGEDPLGTVVIGPGLGQEETTAKELLTFIEKLKNPIVLDADALNIFSKNKKALRTIPENSILTPHPKEFSRLAGVWDSDEKLLEVLKNFSQEYQLIVVFKRANTVISLPDGRMYFNSTGNPGMATAGSGDILTGIIGGLLAQGYSPELSARLGVFLHGLAADLYIQNNAQETLIAEDIITNLSKAFLKLKEQ